MHWLSNNILLLVGALMAQAIAEELDAEETRIAEIVVVDDPIWGLIGRNCREIKLLYPHAPNGLYTIVDVKGSQYRTYCDMKTARGGWTLVASVHENHLGGKCTTGDRWSSEQGPNIAGHPNGDGNWANRNIFGAPESAASDDYKNPGYFNLRAKDVMIWHVPNNKSVHEYESTAFMKYHTTNKFLTRDGHNLYNLFSRNHYPLMHNVYSRITGNGPCPPIVWDRGNNAERIRYTPINMRPQTVPGFIQFRAINNERAAFAICPGLKMTGGDVEHSCIGPTSFLAESPRQCGDFAAKDWDGYASGVGWSSGREMTESVVMIFYR